MVSAIEKMVVDCKTANQDCSNGMCRKWPGEARKQILVLPEEKDMGIIFKKGKSDRLSEKRINIILEYFEKNFQAYLKKIQRQNEFYDIYL